MNDYLQEGVARAQLSRRLDEAESRRRGRQVLAARRLARRAEQAAHRARLALARL